MKKSLATFSAMSPKHQWRYARSESGMSLEEIAKADKVAIATVEESVNMVRAQNKIFGIEALEASTIEIIQANKALEKQALSDALLAERYVYGHGDNAGEVVASEPDHDIRLRAVSEITEKTKAVMAKHAKGNSTNVQVGVGVGVGVTNNDPTNFETRLRDIQKKRRVEVVSQSELPAGAPTLEVVPEREKLAVDGGSSA